MGIGHCGINIHKGTTMEVNTLQNFLNFAFAHNIKVPYALVRHRYSNRYTEAEMHLIYFKARIAH